MSTITRLGATAAGLALTLGSFTVATQAYADPAPSEPCAKESAKLDKANEALARVTAVFERQKEKVKDAKEDVAAADNASERGKARRALAQAKREAKAAERTKKAQVQRVAKATERLNECLAEQPAS